MPVIVTNNSGSTLAAPISNVDTSISIVSGVGFPVVDTAAKWAWATISKASGAFEVVKITSHTLDSAAFTVVRGQDNTTAISFAAGDMFDICPVAALFLDKADVEALDAHKVDTVDVHAASAITNAPAGNIAATTVQAAINELDAEKASLSGATFTGPVTLVTPTLGTPASGTLTNCTGLSPTGLSSVTGTGAAVLATSPALVDPDLGTPSALVGTNITGTAAGLSIGGSASSCTGAAASNVLKDVGVNGVGDISLMYSISGSAIASGATIAGSSLQNNLVNNMGVVSNNGVATTGTWRNLSSTSIGSSQSGTFQRIA